jgi:predicted amidophosphoribosyltransferase
VTAICTSCGQESPDTFRFCPACAAPLDQAVPPAREERTVVTVLFADAG